jgi:5-methylcytosine-specific restriction enzyme subunit McrC
MKDLILNSLACQSISYYFENDVIHYEEQDEKYLQRIAESYRDSGKASPILLNREKKEMSLADGFVGIIRIPSRLIVIRPRYYVFDFDVILKMWLYTRYSLSEGMPLMPKYDVGASSFATDICSIFVKEVRKLLKSGICGDYLLIQDFSEFVRGRIDFAKSGACYQRNRLYCSYDQFSIDTKLNQAILFCLLFVQPLLRDSVVHSELTSDLAAFRGVTLKKHFAPTEIENIVLNRRNSHYQTVLDLCKMIIEHLSIAEVGRTVEFYSFLVNYNKLFEDFIRKLLQETFGQIFSEWPKPRVYASFEDEYGKVEKSFLPDILYDYDPSSSSARIVLDVKNKMRYFSNLDLFQISFYCYMLQTNFGILVYPYSKRRLPKTVILKPLSGKGQLFVSSIFFDLKKMLIDFVSARRDFASDIEKEIAKLFS